MKHIKRLFALIIVLALITSLTTTAFAALAKNEYIVRLYIGAQGTHPDGAYSYKVVERGKQCNLSDIVNAVSLPAGSKYYVKGIRESGKEEQHVLAITNVDKDQDYVVTYGIRGDEVRYRVRYINASTKEDMPNSPAEQWFTANRGDKVYVAYVEFPGFRPNAYNLARTITEDEYTFVFEYSPVPTTTTTTTTTTTGGGGGGGAAVAGGAAANGNANNTANNAANNQNANNPQGVNNPVNNTNTQPNVPTPTQAAEPEEIIDLDVPLAAPNIPGVGTISVPNAPQVIEPNQHGRIPNWMLIAGLVLLVGLIAMLYWYLLFYRKKKKYASINDDYEILGFDNDDDF